MSGYVLVHGPCFVCRRLFSYNPHHVPSYDPSLDDSSRPAGRQPICATCITFANENRKARGLELWDVHPDAYEPLPEGEL